MNQILTTKPVRPKKMVKINTVKTFFAVSMMIFGFCMVSSGSYAMYKSKGTQQAKGTDDQNTVTNNTIVETNSEDIQIHPSVEGKILHATIIGQNEIAFVTYRWDDEEEQKEEIGGVSGDIDIDILSGEHVITITAVDINNKSNTVKQTVRGATNPKIEVVQDGSDFVIKIVDDLGIDKVEFNLNGEDSTETVDGEKEKEFRLPLIEGENKLIVKAYNIEKCTETFYALCRY